MIATEKSSIYTMYIISFFGPCFRNSGPNNSIRNRFIYELRWELDIINELRSLITTRAVAFLKKNVRPRRD